MDELLCPDCGHHIDRHSRTDVCDFRMEHSIGSFPCLLTKTITTCYCQFKPSDVANAHIRKMVADG